MRVRGIVGVLVCALLLVPTTAASAATAKKPRITIRFVSVSQKRLLKRRAVHLRVRSARAGRMRLFTSARHGKTKVVITGVRSVKLRARHTRVVKLELTKAGRREVGGCVKRRLVATAVPVLSVQKGTGRATSVRKLMKRDRPVCLRHPGAGTGTGTGGTGGNGNGPSNGNGGNGQGGNPSAPGE